MKQFQLFWLFAIACCQLLTTYSLKAQNNNEKPLLTIGNNDLIYFTDVIIEQNGKEIIALASNNHIDIYDFSGKTLKSLPAHTKAIGSIAQLINGSFITASDDKSFKIWTDKAELFKTVSNAHSRTITFATGSPKGNFFVTTSEDKTAKIWDANGNPLFTLKGHTDIVNAADFSNDENFVVTASNDNTVRVWNMKGEYIRTFPKFDAVVRSIQYSPDSRQLLVATANEAVLLSHVGKHIATLSGHSGRVNKAVFSPDGKNILTVADDKTMRLWDLEGNLLTTFSGHKRAVTAAAFSPDGKHIVSASLDNTLKIWSVQPDATSIQVANKKPEQTAQATLTAYNPPQNTEDIAAQEPEMTERTGKPSASGATPYAVIQGSAYQPAQSSGYISYTAVQPYQSAPAAVPIFQRIQIPQPQKGSTTPKVWAVVIGISNYNHAQALRFTKDDAYEFYSFLKSPEGGALPDEQIVKLIDASATKNRILFELNRVLSLAGENDVVVIYYAGHGIPAGLLPSDFDGYNNVIPYGDIYNLVESSNAKYKLCIIDACYAGSLTQYAMRGMEDVNNLLYNIYSAYQNASPGTAFLMSSKAEEKSVEYMGLQHGVFSNYLLRGLKGAADANNDKIITITELFDYTRERVRNYTNYIQSPTIFGNYDVNMPVGGVR